MIWKRLLVTSLAVAVAVSVGFWAMAAACWPSLCSLEVRDGAWFITFFFAIVVLLLVWFLFPHWRR